MSRIRYIRRSMFHKKSNAPIQSKQAPQAFFNFGTVSAFFRGTGKEARLSRQSENGEKEKENQSLQHAEKIFDFIKNKLLRMRNDSLKPGAVVQQDDFQILSIAIYALHISPASGLSQAAIWNITNMLVI